MKYLTISDSTQTLSDSFEDQLTWSSSYTDQTNQAAQTRNTKNLRKAGVAPVSVPRKLAHPRRKLDVQATLYKTEHQATSLYIVNQGILKAIIPTAMGKDRIADIYGPGDLLGSAAINGAKHIETVVAVEGCIVTPIDPIQCLGDSAFSKYLVNTLAKQMRRHRQSIDDAELPVGARLTRTLARLAQRFGEVQADGLIYLPTMLTHNEFAEMTGSSRVTMTRIFGELKNSKAIFGNRGDYYINSDLLETATDDYVMEVI